MIVLLTDRLKVRFLPRPPVLLRSNSGSRFFPFSSFKVRISPAGSDARKAAQVRSRPAPPNPSVIAQAAHPSHPTLRSSLQYENRSPIPVFICIRTFREIGKLAGHHLPKSVYLSPHISAKSVCAHMRAPARRVFDDLQVYASLPAGSLTCRLAGLLSSSLGPCPTAVYT